MNTANGGNILFHFKGDDSSLKSTMSSMTSMTKSILVATGITKALSTAWNMVSSSTGDAIDRYDQLNAFPRVMKSLGVGTEDAEKAVKTLSERLKGLPTTLDKGTSAVSRFVATNGDVEKSTEMFLAVNNAILAGNAPMENQAAALEQITQAYSKGKPDMMEWRSLLTAMPGQLKQVAKAMGYVDTNELHDALIQGTVSMDEFMEAIIRLDKEGGEGFDSFQQQAKNAVGGIKTALTNMKTAITRGVSKVIEGIDKGLKNGGVEGGINEIISKIGEGFETKLTEIGELLGTNISGLLTGELTPYEVANNISNYLLEGLKKAMEFMKQQIPIVLPKILDFMLGIMNAVADYLPEILPLLTEMLVGVINVLTDEEFLMVLGEVAGKIITKLVEALAKAIWVIAENDELRETMTSATTSMLLGGGLLFSKIGRALVAGLVEGIVSALTPGATDEEKVAVHNWAKSFVDDPLGVLFPEGKKLIEGLWNGIQEALGLKKPGKNVKQEVKNNVGDTSTTLYSSGEDMAQGFINGMDAKISGVRSKAASLASIVSNAVATVGQIHSPSKLMEWYGEMMGEGYIVGLTNMQKALNETALETFSLSPQLANSMALNNSPNIIVNNYVNNETDPLGQTVSQIKTFANGAKNDYNYGMGV